MHGFGHWQVNAEERMAVSAAASSRALSELEVASVLGEESLLGRWFGDSGWH